MTLALYAMAGPALLLGLACFGSAIGCSYGFIAASAVMSRTDEGHAKFIALAAVPASQTIYGLILMMLMKGAILEGTVTPLSAIAIGISAGAAMFSSSVFQGRLCAASIQAVSKQPSIYGKSIVGVGIIESFSLFALVFSLLLLR